MDTFLVKVPDVGWGPCWRLITASQVALVVKSPPANAGNLRDAGLTPGSRRSPGGGHATHSSILGWRIPWTEEPGWLQSLGLQTVRHNLTTKQQHKGHIAKKWQSLKPRSSTLHNVDSKWGVNGKISRLCQVKAISPV